MTKLPANSDLVKLAVREGLSDKEIAAAFDVTVQAVNKRLMALGIARLPYSRAATAIVEAAWPADETNRQFFTTHYRGRELWYFLRKRLGDPKLGDLADRRANRFEKRIRDKRVVLDLKPGDPDGPWVYVPREETDGRMVIRWPEDRPLPEGEHREALDLPRAPWS